MLVGLGNPGAEYEGTRHNLGAELAQAVARERGIELLAGRERSLCGFVDLEGLDRGRRLAVAIPMSYMNESGDPVARTMRRFGVGVERLLIAHDDLDLALGSLRLKKGGGTAGHRGLESVRARLGGDSSFMRVRMGIGRPPNQMDPAEFVLKRFRKSEISAVEEMVSTGVEAVSAVLVDGIESAMNRFNRSG